VDLAALAGWNRRWLADGIVLAPPKRDGERLSVRGNLRPLRRFASLVGDAGYGELERFTTVEGEYAGIVVVTEPAVTRVVAMVVGDDSYALVEGRTPDPTRAEWFRDLVRTVARFYPFGLGRLRRRRFVYRPPEGWSGVQRHGSVVWIHPDYPRVPAKITVFDARPVEGFAPGAVDRLLFVDENPFATRDAQLPQTPAEARAGFAGTVVRETGRAADGTPMAVEKTLLRDERYLYVAQLEMRIADRDECAPAFAELVRSIEPLPASELDQPARHLIHWIE